MYALDYRVTLLSKVIISGPPTDQNMIETFDYVRGSSLLGTMASRFIQKRQPAVPHKDDTFYRWFLKGDLVFSNAYLTKEEDTVAGPPSMYYPTPLYIQKEKATGDIYNIFSVEADGIKPLGGFSAIDGNKIESIKPQKRISFHHERERLSGTSKKGLIFNYESLSPGQTFIGTISGIRKDLEDFENSMGKSFKAGMGKSKGVEYGDVKIELLNIREIDNKLFPDEDEEEFWEEDIYLTFISPCILLNDLGISDSSLSNIKKSLQNCLGEKTFEIKGSIIRQVLVENYVSIWKMKKPLERAISAGSTLLLSFDFEDGAGEKVFAGLKNLLKKGIGERLGEGFGRVKIISSSPKEYGLIVSREGVEKPRGSPPETVKQLFQTMIRNALLEKVRTEATAEANRFTALPQNSLLGRLMSMAAKTTHEEFSGKIRLLRDKARNQLDCCYSVNNGRKDSLFNYLVGWDEKKLFNLIDQLDAYEKLTRLVAFKPKADNELLLTLWNVYMQTFLKELWWKNKHLLQKEVQSP